MIAIMRDASEREDVTIERENMEVVERVLREDTEQSGVTYNTAAERRRAYDDLYTDMFGQYGQAAEAKLHADEEDQRSLDRHLEPRNLIRFPDGDRKQERCMIALSVIKCITVPWSSGDRCSYTSEWDVMCSNRPFAIFCYRSLAIHDVSVVGPINDLSLYGTFGPGGMAFVDEEELKFLFLHVGAKLQHLRSEVMRTVFSDWRAQHRRIQQLHAMGVIAGDEVDACELEKGQQASKGDTCARDIAKWLHVLVVLAAVRAMTLCEREHELS